MHRDSSRSRALVLLAGALSAGLLWGLLRRGRRRRSEPERDRVETASEDSFPASDPPAWTGASASAGGS
jgi:hypothetical protein